MYDIITAMNRGIDKLMCNHRWGVCEIVDLEVLREMFHDWGQMVEEEIEERKLNEDI